MSGMNDSQARQWGMLCHLSALSLFIGFPFGNFLGPFIIWILKKDDHPFIDEQGKESLNYQISLFIYACAAGILFFAAGWFLLILIGIAAIVFPVIATVRASDGRHYRYPLTIRLIK
ncbi:DUF4870 domain-containing protein [bacterium]|nr:DUF4870 domain-containing protein [bacterium]